MNLPSSIPSLASAAFVSLAGIAAAQAPGPLEISHEHVDFALQIAPILESRCQTCHGAAQQMSGLRLDNRAAALKGGYSGPVLVPKDSEGSRLIRLVSGQVDNLVMPPAGERLKPSEVSLLRAWIDQGADWPDPAGATASEAPEPKTDHWAFRPVRKPALPAIERDSWARNEIDRFVLARLEREGIEPAREASPETLARRVSLDLTGLPPSLEQVAAFLTDPEPDAYESLVALRVTP